MDEKVPVFRSWRRWYILVLGVLVVQIILYYLITVAYS